MWKTSGFIILPALELVFQEVEERFLHHVSHLEVNSDRCEKQPTCMFLPLLLLWLLTSKPLSDGPTRMMGLMEGTTS